MYSICDFLSVPCDTFRQQFDFFPMKSNSLSIQCRKLCFRSLKNGIQLEANSPKVWSITDAFQIFRIHKICDYSYQNSKHNTIGRFANAFLSILYSPMGIVSSMQICKMKTKASWIIKNEWRFRWRYSPLTRKKSSTINKCYCM